LNEMFLPLRAVFAGMPGSLVDKSSNGNNNRDVIVLFIGKITNFNVLCQPSANIGYNKMPFQFVFPQMVICYKPTY